MKSPFSIFFFLLPFFCASQTNLVRNGSFEDHSTCPFLQDQVSYCDFWENPNACTSDYICSCSPILSGIQAPNYWMGFQHPFHGDCYMGIGAFADDGSGDLFYSEYIQTELSKSLDALHIYHLTMYVSLSNHSEFTIHNLGALVSSIRPDDEFWCDTFSNYYPQLVVPFLTDTLNWVKQEVEFVAHGGEKWLTIGRFDFDGPSQVLSVLPESPILDYDYAYYVVDSVSLIDVTDPENLPELPNVISPNGDGFNDEFLLPEYDFLFDETVTIYSRWGNEIAVLNPSHKRWNGTNQSGQPVRADTYFYIFTALTEEGKTIYKRGTISVFR